MSRNPMSWDWRIFVLPGSAWLVLPLVAVLGAVLAARDPSARGPVLRWWAAIAVAVLLVAASKIAFYGWGTGVRAWDLTCFSGHTVMAFAVWPVTLMLSMPVARPALRTAGLIAGVLLAALIGYSRIPLGAHPPSEVLAGVALGGAAALVGTRAMWRQQLPLQLAPVLAVLVVLALALPGRHLPVLPSEKWFAAAGTALSGRDAPVNRKKWRDVISINISQD